MGTIIWTAVILAWVIAIGTLVALRRMAQPPPDLSADLEGCHDLSMTRYGPMQRLLAQDDYDFVAAKLPNGLSMARSLRRQHRRVVLAYMRDIASDHRRVYRTAKRLLVAADGDRSDRLLRLERQRLRFLYTLNAIRVGLLLEPLGADPRHRGLPQECLALLAGQLRELRATAGPVQ